MALCTELREGVALLLQAKDFVNVESVARTCRLRTTYLIGRLHDQRVEASQNLTIAVSTVHQIEHSGSVGSLGLVEVQLTLLEYLHHITMLEVVEKTQGSGQLRPCLQRKLLEFVGLFLNKVVERLSDHHNRILADTAAEL